MSFSVIPAIDLLDHQVVRLHQGRYTDVTVYSDDPVALARDWAQRGVRRLHVVDLAGAKSGTPEHLAVISAMSQIPGLAVEVGGGIRTLDTMARYLEEAKARWVILGTIACTNPTLVREACARWPDRILVGLDARNGRVAVNGWLEETDMTPIELGRSFADAGVAGIIYTDIMRDGTGTGANIESTAALALATGVPVIASGGVATIQDIQAIAGVASSGVQGVVVGRAILSGTIPVEAAMKVGV